MRDTDLLQLALGIMPPWLVEAATFDAEILSPAKTSERIKVDYEKWGRVVREANIRAE